MIPHRKENNSFPGYRPSAILTEFAYLCYGIAIHSAFSKAKSVRSKLFPIVAIRNQRAGRRERAFFRIRVVVSAASMCRSEIDYSLLSPFILASGLEK